MAAGEASGARRARVAQVAQVARVAQAGRESTRRGLGALAAGGAGALLAACGAPAWAFLTWMVTQQVPQGLLNQTGKLGVPPYKPIYDTLFLQEPRTDVKRVLGEMASANHPYLEGLTVVPQAEKIFADELKGVWAGSTTAREATRRIADQLTPLLNQ